MHPLRLSATTGLAILLVLAFAAPAFAKGPGGNSTAAKACQDGGFQSFTDADHQAFRNAGQCVRYAAGGGALVPVAEESIPIVLTITYGQPSQGSWSAHIEWSGLEPGSEFVIKWDYASGEYVKLEFGSLNDAGEGSWPVPSSFACVDDGSPLVSAAATATPAGGTEQTFAVPLPGAVCAP